MFFPPRETDLVDVRRLGRRPTRTAATCMTYTPTNQKQDGTWREIGRRRGAAIASRTRAGYFAPSPPPIRPRIEFTVTDASHAYRRHRGRRPRGRRGRRRRRRSTRSRRRSIPCRSCMALDSSGSMKKSAPTVRQTARDFVARRAARRQPRADHVRRQAAVRARARDEPAMDARRDRQVQPERRHGAVRRAVEFAAAPEGRAGTARDRGAHRRPRRKQSRHGARQHAHARRSAEARARGRRDDLPDRPWDQGRRDGARRSWRPTRAAKPTSRPSVRSWAISSAGSSTTCGGATCSATRRRTRRTTASGERSKSGPATAGSPSPASAAISRPNSNPPHSAGFDGGIGAWRYSTRYRI